MATKKNTKVNDSVDNAINDSTAAFADDNEPHLRPTKRKNTALIEHRLPKKQRKRRRLSPIKALVFGTKKEMNFMANNSKKETLKQLQARLDGEKWMRSISTSCDQSGMMYYCKGCVHSVGDGYHCDATQDERVSGTLCARSYRRVKGGETEK